MLPEGWKWTGGGESLCGVLCGQRTLIPVSASGTFLT
jgi:hypothetical protein